MTESTENQNIMDNEYGHTDIPPILKPLDIREKYWGKITSVCKLENCTLKVIDMKANTQSSLEFHTQKDETYYILSGKVKLGIRYGRGQNKSVLLEKGDVYHVPKGVMHMHKLILASCAGSSLVVTITIIVDTSAQVTPRG